MPDFSSDGPYVGARIERSIKEDPRQPFVEGVVVGYLDADKSDFVDAKGRSAPLYRVRYDRGILPPARRGGGATLSPISARVDCCRAPRSSIVLLELPVSCPHPRPE